MLNIGTQRKCIFTDFHIMFPNKFIVVSDTESNPLTWRSHQPRFHPDLNRGLYRERVGVVLSAPIRSYHVLMSILTIGLIVEKILAAKNIFPINTIASTIGTIASDRMTS